MQTALADFIKHARRQRGGFDPAQVRALRLLHCHVPDVSTARRRARRPRGRIYLIKQVLEGHEVTAKTQLHLDRCLTCRNCETTCPSGVKCGRLVDIGRKIVDDHVPRPAADRLARIALKEGVTSALFGPAMRVGQMMRPLLPRSLQTRCRRGKTRDTGPHVRMHARRCCWKAAYNHQWRRTSTPPRRACSMRLASKHYARPRPAV